MALLQDVTVNGEALSDFGLQADDEISGIGLVTFGLLWPGIWTPCSFGVSSTWTDCGAAPSTTWTEC